MTPAYSVLIGDVVHSSRRSNLRAVLAERLSLANAAHMREKRIRVPYAITAGDEFQVVASSIEIIPELILDLRRRMRPLDLRIGIGIGGIQGAIKEPANRLVGEAFSRARTAIEDVKNRKLHRYPVLTAFCSTRTEFDRLANLVYGLNDTLFAGVTRTQWRTIDAYFVAGSVDGAAKLLRLDSSTVSRNLKRGSYWQLTEVIVTMKEFFRDEWRSLNEKPAQDARRKYR